MSNRKSTKKDTGGLEESGAFSNDAFVKDEGPPVGNSEREIEKYRRSTIKKTISANRFFNKAIEDENEDDGVAEDQSRRLSMDKKKRKAYHRQHCAKRKFRDSQNHNAAPTKKKQSSKKRMPRDEYGHRLERAFSISSESNTSHTELQGIDHHENFSSMPWYSSCSIWLQQMLAAAVEDLINTKEAFVIRMCKSFLDDSADQPAWDTLPSDCHSIGVLVSALKGNIDMLKYFLGLGGDANAIDLLNRTALHYAASSSSSNAPQCIELLIEHGAAVDVWDRNEEATPLICAAASGRIELVEVLLNAGAEVNAGLSDPKHLDGSSPLLWAIRARSLVCATRLIKAGAAVNSLQVYTESPIHVAAVQGDVQCMQLLLENQADIRVVFGAERRNALHLASFEGNVECIRLLLQTSKAQINTKDALGRTPLHLAALSQSVDSVKELLENGAEIDNCDEMKETPLHGAVVKCRQSTDVVKLLIFKGANVNAKDQFGQTPLHIAAFNENSKLAILLIHSGADLSIKNRAKISALASVVRRVPDALTAISRKLDSAIDVVDNEPADPDCQLKLDLRVLVPGGNQQNVGEMGFLTSLVAAEQRHILQHPIIGAFLHLKWMKIRTTFIVSLIFQLLYVLALTSNIYSIYVVKMNTRVNDTQTTNNTTNNSTNNSTCDTPKNMTQFTDWPIELDTTLWYLTVLLGAATGVKEFFQLYCNAHEYARDIENYFQLISIFGMILILSPHPMHTNEPDNGDWQHHVAAIVIIVAWINLMLHVGRFPVFGLYVQMFTTVAWNIGKLLVAYMSLIIGFSLGFAVLFPLQNRYNDMPYALLMTIVMMTGEMDYANMYTEGIIKYPGTTHFVFLVFLLFVVIVLMNLLVGLAVSDIQGLQKSAGLDRLVRLTKQIARMESFVFFPWPIHFSSIWSKVPRREFIRRNVLVVSPKTRKNYNFRPNDPRDKSFPPEIKESLLKIIAVRIANKKKGAQQKTSHVPIIRTSTIPLDSNNGELFTEVMNRVDELFHNYMTQIVTINSTIEDQLAQLTAKYNYPSTRSRQTRHSCDCSMINEESFSVPGMSSLA